jgi:hypothetical protein
MALGLLEFDFKSEVLHIFCKESHDINDSLFLYVSLRCNPEKMFSRGNRKNDT